MYLLANAKYAEYLNERIKDHRQALIFLPLKVTGTPPHLSLILVSHLLKAPHFHALETIKEDIYLLSQ